MEEIMRAAFLFAVILLSGCKTAEFVLAHPGTGVQVVARFTPPDPATLEPMLVVPSQPVVAAREHKSKR